MVNKKTQQKIQDLELEKGVYRSLAKRYEKISKISWTFIIGLFLIIYFLIYSNWFFRFVYTIFMIIIVSMNIPTLLREIK